MSNVSPSDKSFPFKHSILPSKLSKLFPAATYLPRNLDDVKQYLKDPLYKNSFFIMLTSITSSGFGFIFWMLAAKLYLKEELVRYSKLFGIVSSYTFMLRN